MLATGSIIDSDSVSFVDFGFSSVGTFLMLINLIARKRAIKMVSRRAEPKLEITAALSSVSTLGVSGLEVGVKLGDKVRTLGLRAGP